MSSYWSKKEWVLIRQYFRKYLPLNYKYDNFLKISGIQLKEQCSLIFVNVIHIHTHAHKHTHSVNRCNCKDPTFSIINKFAKQNINNKYIHVPDVIAYTSNEIKKIKERKEKQLSRTIELKLKTLVFECFCVPMSFSFGK